MKNLQEQVEKAFCYQKLFLLFEQIVLVISKFFEFSAFSFEFQKFFSIT